MEEDIPIPEYLNKHFIHLGKPILNEPELGITIQNCTDKYKRHGSIIRVKIRSHYERFQQITDFLLSNNLSKQYTMLRFYNIFFEEVDRSNEMIILCDKLKEINLQDYLNGEMKEEEQKLHMCDVIYMLQTAYALEYRGIPFALNRYCISAVKSNESPSFEMMFNPLIFYMTTILSGITGVPENEISNNERTKDYVVETHSMMHDITVQFCHLKGMETLLDAFESRLPMNEITKLQFVSDLYKVISIPHFDINAFEIIKSLGKGTYGNVMLVKFNDEYYAMKESSYQNMNELKKEGIVMRMCHHENIVKCYGLSHNELSLTKMIDPEFMCAGERYYLALEYCDGHSLYDYLESTDELLDMSVVKNIFKQMVSGLVYLHDVKGMIHRDIKLQNFLIKDENGDKIVKLCDFGFATSNTDIMESRAGNLLTCSPEIYNYKTYNDKSDIYSLGVCLYQLITNKDPFKDEEELKLLKDDANGMEISFDEQFKLNEDYQLGVALVRKMMKKKPDERISWEELKNDPFLN